MFGLEFGEKVQWRRAIAGARSNKLDLVWEDGCYAGYRSLSGEPVVSTKGGVFRTRTMRRIPETMRWHTNNFDEFVHVPWKVNAAADEAAEVMADPEPPAPSSHPEVSMEPPAIAAGADAPRKLYIKKKM